MIYKGFRIENTPAYIWRIYCWGSHAGHNHVACWYVFDADGKRVTGGFTPGNNTRSGTVDLARRKDAKAWVDGYCAFQNEPENRKVCADGTAVYGPSYACHAADTEQQASFDAGYWEAQRRTSKKAKAADNAMLDTDQKPLEMGALYSCVTKHHGHTEHGRLVRYCGKDTKTGRELFADADTWVECSIHGEGLMAQLSPAIDPTTQGWPKLVA